MFELSLGNFRFNLPMRIFRLQSFGIFRLETAGRLAPAGWDFRLGFFAWKLPFKIVRFEISIGNFRLGSFAWKLSLDSFRLGSFVWDHSFTLELSLWTFRFGTCA